MVMATSNGKPPEQMRASIRYPSSTEGWAGDQLMVTLEPLRLALTPFGGATEGLVSNGG